MAIFVSCLVWAMLGQPAQAEASATTAAAAGDQHAKLQQLIDSQAAVVFPPGTHVITQPLVVDLRQTGFRSIAGAGVARLVMAGPGPALRLVGNHGGTADPATVKPETWDRERMPLVDGLEIVGDHPQACGIEAVGTLQLTLTRLNIRKCLHAIHLVRRNRNVLVADSHLYENRGVGLFLDDVDLHQINVTNCHISYNAQGGVVSKAGNVRNLHITGCDLEGNMGGPESPPSANVLLDSTGGVAGIGEVAITGCTIQHTRKAPDSANIRILGATKPELREGHVTITGNVLSDVQCNIHLRGTRGVVITGNTFWEGFAGNLLVEESSNVLVGVNLMDRNPRYNTGEDALNHIVFRQCQDCTLNGVQLTRAGGPAAISLIDCRRVFVLHCTILDPRGTGVRFERAANCRLQGAIIDHADPPTDWRPTVGVE